MPSRRLVRVFLDIDTSALDDRCSHLCNTMASTSSTSNEIVRDRKYYADEMRCFVSSCKKYRRDNPYLTYLRIPQPLKEVWCKAIERNCPKMPLYVCDEHINVDQDCYRNKSGKLRLKCTANLILTRIYSEVSEQEVQPGPSKALSTTTSLDSAASKEQDPLSSRVKDQCRFCGESSKDCVAVSDNVPYLAHNKTTLVLNDTSVQLDFNDGSLPKTVCGDCDAKLQEIADFVKVVKSAQDTLIGFAQEKAEYAETRVEFKVAKAEETVNTETETLVIKTEYDSQHEESDDDKEDKEGIVDSLTVGETVFVKKTITHKRKSDSVTAKPKKLKTVKTKQCDDELIIDIKEVIEKEGQGLSEVSDYVKPSELEMATSALVFEMTSEHQGYRSDT